MIPLKDNVKHEKFPIVNLILIFLNIFVFFYEISLGLKLNAFINEFGVVPSRFLSSTSINMPRLTPLFSSMFMHANILHLGGNMLFLFIFGDNVEDNMGHIRYFFFYIIVGILSSLAHIYTNASSAIPSLGASGAIAGVLGAYILLFPRARVSTLIFLIFFFQAIEVPAWVFLGLWFLIQIVSGVQTSGANSGGVAWWAHIGGFISGAVLILFFKRKKKEDFLRYF